MNQLHQRLALYLGRKPSVDSSVFIAQGAVLLGAVQIAEESSVWFQTVIRADLNEIRVGKRTNLQDGCILHVADRYALEIGNDVSCGHQSLLHACRIHDRVLIGMGAVIMDGAEIGSDTIIGARALITKGTCIPAGSLVVGSPARIVRSLETQERNGVVELARKYVEVARYYRENGRKVGPTGFDEENRLAESQTT